MGKKTNTILLTLAIAGAAYFVSKIRNRTRKDNTYLAQAIIYMKEQNYSKAIECFSRIKNKNNEIYLKMADCHEKLENYIKSIECIDKCLKTSLDFQLVEKKFLLDKKREDFEATFKDVFLMNILNPNYQVESSYFLKKVSEIKASRYKITGWASNINFNEFFNTIAFLDDINDPISVFIRSGEYSKCFEYVKDGASELQLFIKGCFSFVNGDWIEAIKIFSEKEYMYSKIISYWIKTHKDAGKMGVDKNIIQSEAKSTSVIPKTALHNMNSDGKLDVKANEEAPLQHQDTEIMYDNKMLDEWSKSTDVTIQFYLAKIFENFADQDQQMYFINKCIENKRTAFAISYKIICLIKQQDAFGASKLIEEAIKEFPDDIYLFCIAIEYFIIINDIQKANESLEELERLKLTDARIFVLKFLVGKAAGNLDNSLLRAAIKIDPLYFKSYIYLGKQLLGTEESTRVFEKALSCARSYGELHAVFQLKTVIDTQNELLEKYPDLFEK